MRRQRLAYASAAVQREHQLTDEALPQWVALDHPRQFSDDFLVARQPQLCVEPTFKGGQPRIIEASAEDFSGLDRRGAVERGTRPQPKRPVQQGCRLLIAGSLPGLPYQSIESMYVDVYRIGPQCIPRALPDQ